MTLSRPSSRTLCARLRARLRARFHARLCARRPARHGACAALAGALGCVVALAACVASAPAMPTRSMVVTGPPPAPIAEPVPPRPGADAVWVSGYWHWTGIQYAWIPGHWERPVAGATWRAPRYMNTDGSYFYEPGAWMPRANVPNANAIR